MRPSAALLFAALAACLLACAESEARWRSVEGPAPEAPAGPDAPDVLVVMLDTLRPDHLGCYGYERETSPFLDRWSAGAARYERAYSHGTHTRIATASLFTGTLPGVHRIENVELTPGESGGDVTDALAASLTTWAESLAAVGYDTWAFSANPHISPVFGFEQGFHRFWATSHRHGDALVDAFLARLKVRGNADHPLFAYLHAMDPHNPYKPPVGYRYLYDVARGRRRYTNGSIDVGARDLAWTVAQYDGEIRFLDAQLERLITAWEAGGTRPRVTIVLSDHGDELLEHGGLGHGHTVFEELARTVLLIRGPGIESGVVSEPVAHVDVHRLVLDLAGAPLPDEAQGRPQAAWMNTEAELVTGSRAGAIGFRRGGFTLVVPPGGQAACYDRAADPGEREPLSDEIILRTLLAELDAIRTRGAETAARLGTPARKSLSAETTAELRAIGYLDGDE